jgi:hypothetical protein
MKFQRKAPHSFTELLLEPTRILLVLKTYNDVIGVSHDDNVSVRMPLPPLLYPQIEDVVQVHVGEQRRGRSPLRCTLTCRPLPFFQDSRRQPLLDEAQNPRVRDPVLYELHQPFVVYGVEEPANVCVQHPVHPLPHDGYGQCVQRLMLAAPWPKPIRETAKVHLVNGVQHLDHGTLDNLVLERRNAERPLPPVRLRYVHST